MGRVRLIAARLRYTKAEHRRALKPKLSKRSEGAIEYKHQNVSAVWIELGLPYILGYKPAFNYQHQLKKVVLSYLAGHQHLLNEIGQEAEKAGNDKPQLETTWHQILDPDPPERIPQPDKRTPAFLARHIDFSERERRNRKLGQRAEEFVSCIPYTVL